MGDYSPPLYFRALMRLDFSHPVRRKLIFSPRRNPITGSVANYEDESSLTDNDQQTSSPTSNIIRNQELKEILVTENFPFTNAGFPSETSNSCAREFRPQVSLSSHLTIGSDSESQTSSPSSSPLSIGSDSKSQAFSPSSSPLPIGSDTRSQTSSPLPFGSDESSQESSSSSSIASDANPRNVIYAILMNISPCLDDDPDIPEYQYCPKTLPLRLTFRQACSVMLRFLRRSRLDLFIRNILGYSLLIHGISTEYPDLGLVVLSFIKEYFDVEAEFEYCARNLLGQKDPSVVGVVFKRRTVRNQLLRRKQILLDTSYRITTNLDLHWIAYHSKLRN